jgi:hypothetical protein
MENGGKIKVGGIMAHSGLATVSILSFPDRPDIPGMILHAMGKENINIESTIKYLFIRANLLTKLSLFQMFLLLFLT